MAQKVKPKYIPPDGGWGWVIVFAAALSYITVIPIMQSFGLLFKDTFINMGMSATDLALILNVNSAFGMGLGFVNGALLRTFGFRKVGICASLLTFVGVTSTAWANSFAAFLVTYSIISSIGMTLTISSISLALNTYFKVRRSRAAGISLTATGLGPILMPQLISFLLENYGSRGSALILGAMSLHALVATLLLQPVKWHAKREVVAPQPDIDTLAQGAKEKDLEILMEEDECESKPGPQSLSASKGSTSIPKEREVGSQSIRDCETPLLYPENKSTIRSRMANIRSISCSEEETKTKPESKYDWLSASLDNVHLGSSLKIYDEKYYESQSTVDHEKTREAREDVTNTSNKKSTKSTWKETFKHILVFFDLDLLQDPSYVSLVIGMSLAITAELNFSLLVPFIMGDLGFQTNSIAVLMSVIATTDLIFRFITPFVADALKYSAKKMFLISLVMLIITRTALTFFQAYTPVLCVCALLGIGKGVRTVYMTLVIPAYVPLERLPGASGIQMVINGTAIMVFGPLLGAIRDWSGNYNTCIMAINGISSLTLTIWITEYLISWCRKRAKKPQKESTSQET